MHEPALHGPHVNGKLRSTTVLRNPFHEEASLSQLNQPLPSSPLIEPPPHSIRVSFQIHPANLPTTTWQICSSGVGHVSLDLAFPARQNLDLGPISRRGDQGKASKAGGCTGKGGNTGAGMTPILILRGVVSLIMIDT